jgi:hypothetical protein
MIRWWTALPAVEIIMLNKHSPPLNFFCQRIHYYFQFIINKFLSKGEFRKMKGKKSVIYETQIPTRTHYTTWTLTRR